MPTSADNLVATYLRALTDADAELVVSLFAEDGSVHSPLYGPRPAADFYPSSRRSGRCRFDVVDVATLAPDGKIKDLHVIYDTVEVRPAFEAETGQSSWRRPQP